LKGTFSHCIDEAAFADTVEVNLDAEMGSNWQQVALNVRSLPIGGGKKSSYARERQAVLRDSRNRVAVKHGRMKTFPNMPRIKLRIHSERNPVTGMQVVNAVEALTQELRQLAPSWIEMTFDLTGVSVNDIYNRVFSRASFGRRFFGPKGLETFYRGTRKSIWSLRVYAKPPAITRLEYVLRRGFLKSKGISRVQDITRLRNIDLRRLTLFREVEVARLQELVARLRQREADLILRTAEYHPQLAERALRIEYRLDTSRAFPVSALQQKIERMQKSFIW
jgi:hypothetical protein